MAIVVNGLKAFRGASSLSEGTILRGVKEPKYSKVTLQRELTNLQYRISCIGPKIEGHSKHIAWPPRQYSDYTPSETALVKLQFEIDSACDHLNLLKEEYRDFSTKQSRKKIVLFKNELERSG